MRQMKSFSSFMAAVTLVALIIVGCSSGGGGGSAASTQTASTSTTSTALGQVTMTVTRANAQKSQPREVPAATAFVRVTVIGTNLVQTVAFPPNATQIQVVINNVPLGLQSIRVEALDANNNVLASNIVAVEVATNTEISSTVTLTPNPSPTASATASPAASPSPTAGASPSVGPNNALRFSTQPPTTVADGFQIASPIRVSVLDANGNVDASFSAPITLSLLPNPANALLTPASTTSSLTATPSAGIATFTGLTVMGQSPALSMRATASSLSTTSTPFASVKPKLVFIAQPEGEQMVSGLLAAHAGGVTVQVQNSADNTVVASAGGNVVLSLSPNPSLATLSGNSSALSGGTTTFSSLSLDKVGTGYALVASAGGLTQASSSFDAGPQVIAPDVYVGTTTGTVDAITHYDVNFRQVDQATSLTYTACAMAVVTNANGTYLFVAGNDNQLHVYNRALIEQPNSPYPLSFKPHQMRQDPVNHMLYISEATGVGTDGTFIYDLTSFVAGSPTLAPTASVTGQLSVAGLGVDPSTSPGFWLAFYNTTGGQLTSYAIPGNGPQAGHALGSTAANGFLDLMRTGARVAGIVTDPPSSTTLSGFSASPFDPLSSATFGPAFNAADVRKDVRFYAASGGTATALVANDASGQIELAVVTPQQSPVPTTVSVMTAVADPNGFIGASGAEYISLLNSSASQAAMGIVTDPSKNRLMLVDLTNSTPTLYSVVPLGNSVVATCITSFQAGVSTTH